MPGGEKGGGKVFVKGQYGNPEPLAQQGVGNALYAHAALAVVQQNTVAAVIIAALMHKAAHFAVLGVVHSRQRSIVHGSAPFCGSAGGIASVRSAVR